MITQRTIKRLSTGLAILATLILYLHIGGQAATSQKSEFDRERYRELSEELDFGEPEKEEQEEASEQEPATDQGSPEPFKIDSFWGKVILAIVAISILVFLLLRLFGNKALFGNKKVRREDQKVKVENLEEYIHETDLERFLKDALDKGNIPQAIRVYYLMIIKTLSENEWIDWRKNKTNYEYVQELKGRPQYPSFRNLTFSFEEIWYGEKKPDPAILQQTLNTFRKFFESLNRQEHE